MFRDLDDPSSRDPVRVGSKAAALAVARAAGAAVLPGFVVEGAASTSHLRAGAATLDRRGSGGARLTVSAAPIPFAEELVAAGANLGDRLVARSSTLLEASGEWSGAFTSYVDVSPAELPKAVVGCWASAFTVAALERQKAAGVQPGSFPMSVLVQSALQPEAGGWAELADQDQLVVYGTKGSPAPLLQGWEAGQRARYDGGWRGDGLIDLVGTGPLEELRLMMSTIAGSLGVDRCEWALADRMWALQVGRSRAHEFGEAVRPSFSGAAELLPSIEAIVLAPGPLGEETVLPWAIAGIPPGICPEGPQLSPDAVRQLARELTCQVWGMPWARADREARRLTAELRGVDPRRAANRMGVLRKPDPQRASTLLSSLQALRTEMVERGIVNDERAAWHLSLDEVESALAGQSVSAPPRVGIGPWEPLVASVVLSAVTPRRGTPASAGVGAGIRTEVEDPHQRSPGRRRVVTASHPLPNLAALLWDSAGLVTRSGSPAAHLFEAARALRVPAVCNVEMGPAARQVVAVDGTAGLVAILDLERSF